MLVRLWVILAIAVQPLLGLAMGSACACREPAPVKCSCGDRGGCCGADEQVADGAATAQGDDEPACCGAANAPDDSPCCSGSERPMTCAVCAALCRGPAAPIAPVQRASVPRPPRPAPMPMVAWARPIFGGDSIPARCAGRVERRSAASGRAILDLHCIRQI